MNYNNAFALVKIELSEATSKFGKFASQHEGIAVIREEYLELEKEVFKKQSEYDHNQLKKEATQLAAMAIRFLIDCEEE